MSSKTERRIENERKESLTCFDKHFQKHVKREIRTWQIYREDKKTEELSIITKKKKEISVQPTIQYLLPIISIKKIFKDIIHIIFLSIALY